MSGTLILFAILAAPYFPQMAKTVPQLPHVHFGMASLDGTGMRT